MKLTFRFIVFFAMGLLGYIFYMTALVVFFLEMILPHLLLSDGQAGVVVGIVILFSLISGGVLLSLFFIRPLVYIMSMISKLSQDKCSFVSIGDLAYRRNGKVKLRYYLYQEVIRDIDELSRKLEQANFDREQLEVEKKDWISGVSHDLKTPLAYVMGYAEILLHDNVESPIETDDRQRYIKEIYDKSNYINDLIKDLSLIYRQERDSNSIPLALEKFNLVNLLQTLVVDIMNDPHAATYEINFDSERDTIPVNADSKLLYRACQNLLMNAVNHNPQNTEINVKITADNDYYQISISDNGTGLTDNAKENLFTRYYHGSSEQEQDHTRGMGLVIVKNIVEAHYGTISVVSELSVGTTFSIRCPVN